MKSIQVQLKARGGHPVTSILELVNKIKSEIQEEQTQKQTEYEAEKTNCETYETSLTDENTLNQDTIDDNNKKIVDLTNQLDSYEQELQDSETLKQSKEDQISSLKTIREDENSIYQSEVAELNQMVQALRDGKALLQQLLVSNSTTGQFFEKNNILIKPNNKDFERVISLLQKKKNGYLKLGTMLFQMVAKQENVDQDLLNNVLDLINELINQLLDNVQTKTETEEARKTTYNTEKTTLESSLIVVNSNIAGVEASIQEIQDELLNLNEDSVDLQNKIKANEGDISIKDQECQDYYHSYVSESQDRWNFFIFYFF